MNPHDQVNSSHYLMDRFAKRLFRLYSHPNTIRCQIAWVDASNSIEIIFCICSHRAVTDGIRNTQQCKTSSNLVIVKEALIALID